MLQKTVIVLGPEGSGSKLCARIIAHSLGTCDFNEWEGFLWAPNENKTHNVLHRSIPSGEKCYIIDIDKIIKEHKNIFFILTTRDKNISKRSRKYTEEEHQKWIKKNKEIIKRIKKSASPYMFFSYETFMLYKEIYLKELYDFLEIDSNFIPELIDGNKKYIKEV